MTDVKLPNEAADVEKMRNWINERFADRPQMSLKKLRESAHFTLDKILLGDHVGGNIGVQRLGPDGACDMRAALRRFNIKLEVAT